MNNTNPILDNFIQYKNTGKNNIFRVDLHIISGCNFRCIMCDNWKREIELNLSETEVLELIRKLYRDYHCRYIRFHGQEPTLYQGLERAVFFAKKLGIKVAIKTNGWLLSDAKLVTLLWYGLDEIYLSIDGPSEEVNDIIRGKVWAFRKNLRILGLAKKISPGVKTYINSVVMDQNSECIDKMVDLGHAHNVDRVSFVFLNTKNKEDISDIALSEDRLMDFFRKTVPSILRRSIETDIPVDFSPNLSSLCGQHSATVLKGIETDFLSYEDEIRAFASGEYGKHFYDRYGCSGPIDHASINYTGDMYGCCVVDRSPENSVGNIIESDVSRLWSSDRYQAYRDNSDEHCGHAKLCASNFFTRKSLFRDIYLKEELYDTKTSPVRYYRYLRELYETDYRLIEQIRTRKFRSLLLSVYETHPFYRDILDHAGITRAEIETAESYRSLLARLPILDKSDLLQFYNAIIGNINLTAPNIDTGETAGSTGESLEYYYPRNFTRFVKQVSVFSRQSGFVFSDAYFSFTPRNCNFRPLGDEPGYVKKKYLPLPDKFDLNDRVYFQKLHIFLTENNDIRFLHSDSRHLLFAVLGLRAFGFPLPGLTAIFLTYSHTGKQLRKFLAETLKAPVFDNYGCSEVGPIAGEIAGKWKILSESVIVESVDGELVITDLDNPVFPFIRYRNGDMGEVRDNSIVLSGKKEWIINGRTLREIDDFLSEQHPEVITYQFYKNEFLYYGKEVVVESVIRSLEWFLGITYRPVSCTDRFFETGSCSKFHPIIL